MDIFIARQPIFDLNQRPVAYELLYRCDRTNVFPDVDGLEATSRLLCNVFNTFSISEITGGRRAFVNFTRELLVSGLPDLISPDQVVLEVLEDITVDAALVQACRDLVKKGYCLALDDFVLTKSIAPLIPLASVIKIDWRANSLHDICQMIESLKNYSASLLAEKVETRQGYEQAKSMGCRFFQGFFFSRPIIVQRNDVPPSSWSRLQILQALHGPSFTLEKAEEIISRDVSLTFKVLRYINSAAFGLRTEISSLRHAVAMLGERNVRQWLSLFVLANLGTETSAETVYTACVRAKFGELLAEKSGRLDAAPCLFLVGVLSLLDVLFGRPLAELLEMLSLEPAITQALLKGKGPWGRYYRLVLTYERGLWTAVEKWGTILSLAPATITDSYLEAVQWANRFAQVTSGADLNESPPLSGSDGRE